MMFTVTWKRKALDELADLWNNADDRNAVAAASDIVDERLGRDPLGFGESRDSGERLAYHGPLAVYFRVDSQRRIVSVLSIGAARPPRQ